MCRFKSGIILKDSVYIPDTDSHTDMLEKLKIEDNYINTQKIFVRAELNPLDGDLFGDIEKWTFKVDQDILPDWFDKEADKQRMIEAVKDWAKNRIYIGVDGLELKDGANYMLKDCKNIVLYGNSQVNKMCGKSQVNEMYDNSKVYGMYDKSQVKAMYDNSKVYRMYNKSQVRVACGKSKVYKMYNKSRTYGMCGNSQVYRMYDKSRVYGMWGNSKVNGMYDKSRVYGMWGNSQISIYSKTVKIDNIIRYNNSIIKDYNTNMIYLKK